MNRVPSARQGFSLLEVLVAMVILTVGATSLIALFAAAAATHKRSVDRTHAAMVAEEIVGEVQARYLPGAELEEIEASLREDLPPAINGYAWEVVLVRPGQAGARGAVKAPQKTGGKKGAPVLKSTRTTVAAPKTTARKPVGKPVSRKEGADSSSFTDEEILLRVIVYWLQNGRTMTETFDTILLPRPFPLSMRQEKK